MITYRELEQYREYWYGYSPCRETVRFICYDNVSSNVAWFSCEDGVVRKLELNAISHKEEDMNKEKDSQPQNAALDKQVGGNHYKKFKIQPIEFIHKNNIPFIEGNVIKYICRWRDKNGIQDLEKVKHYVDLLIQMEKDD